MHMQWIMAIGNVPHVRWVFKNLMLKIEAHVPIADIMEVKPTQVPA